VALRTSFTHRQRVALVRVFAQDIANRYGSAVDFALHAPHPTATNDNHQAPLSTTARIAAVDDEMRDMNSLRGQFLAPALASQRNANFPARGCGVRNSPDTCGSAGEQERAVLVGQPSVLPLLATRKPPNALT